MKLNNENLCNGKLNYLKYHMPRYDVNNVNSFTKENPTWLHFGAGNIFKAFICAKQQELLNTLKSKTGIIIAETFDEEVIKKNFERYDNLTINVSLKGNGEVDKTIISSISEALAYSNSQNRIKEIVCAPSLQIISFTITEKGYSIKDNDGKILKFIAEDLANFSNPKSLMGIITKLLLFRYQAGKLPLALVSLDNCSHNGTILQSAIMEFAHHWVKEGFIEEGFIDYLQDEKYTAFTWSMIDKITPRPSEEILDQLISDGLEDISIEVTTKNTYISAFVNAEESEYLAIEDKFPNGRPCLEEVGVIFSDRQTIDRIEKMKVCTCLNPLHTTLAIFGCLLGYNSISQEMKDPILRKLIETVGYIDGMPVVVDPKIISAKKFIDDCINVRFVNPFVPDTPQRIACDTSKKIPVRFGETLKAYLQTGETDLSFLKGIPLVLAGWLRYLMGVDDDLHMFTISPDPNLPYLLQQVKGLEIGKKNDYTAIKTFLSNSEVFGVNLDGCNLADKVLKFLSLMVSEKGAVRKTLEEYL